MSEREPSPAAKKKAREFLQTRCKHGISPWCHDCVALAPDDFAAQRERELLDRVGKEWR